MTVLLPFNTTLIKMDAILYSFLQYLNELQIWTALVFWKSMFSKAIEQTQHLKKVLVLKYRH